MYILIKKILKKIIEKVIKNSYQRPLALLFDTHIDFSAPIIKNSYLKFSQLDISGINQKTVDYLVNMFISHRFDLLGSGWVKNSYDSVALGVEGYKYNCNSNISDFDHDGNWLKHVLLRAHIKKSREIWKLVSDDYIPVDWQKDFKSGYRWSAKRFYKDQKVAPKLGVDIKVPWELARLQHLPQLAIFTQVLPNLKYKIIKEFRNQVLDFIATNPPRMGVNWMCAMDVAIRAANLLLAYDMFVQIDGVDKVLDNDFKQLFSMSIYEHALHIVNNLEWSNYLTTNHYLS
ncbi:MAG TPA: hypothetical protein DEG23_02280, partial [Coxiellaceae bacterium]|nr:hypothetical protein [Coxiellaceae bacterium]